VNDISIDVQGNPRIGADLGVWLHVRHRIDGVEDSIRISRRPIETIELKTPDGYGELRMGAALQINYAPTPSNANNVNDIEFDICCDSMVEIVGRSLDGRYIQVKTTDKAVAGAKVTVTARSRYDDGVEGVLVLTLRISNNHQVNELAISPLNEGTMILYEYKTIQIEPLIQRWEPVTFPFTGITAGSASNPPSYRMVVTSCDAIPPVFILKGNDEAEFRIYRDGSRDSIGSRLTLMPDESTPDGSTITEVFDLRRDSAFADKNGKVRAGIRTTLRVELHNRLSASAEMKAFNISYTSPSAENDLIYQPYPRVIEFVNRMQYMPDSALSREWASNYEGNQPFTTDGFQWSLTSKFDRPDLAARDSSFRRDSLPVNIGMLFVKDEWLYPNYPDKSLIDSTLRFGVAATVATKTNLQLEPALREKVRVCNIDVPVTTAAIESDKLSAFPNPVSSRRGITVFYAPAQRNYRATADLVVPDDTPAPTPAPLPLPVLPDSTAPDSVQARTAMWNRILVMLAEGDTTATDDPAAPSDTTVAPAGEPPVVAAPSYYVQIHTIEGYPVRYQNAELMIPMVDAATGEGVARLYIDLARYGITQTGPYIVSVHDAATKQMKSSVVVVVVAGNQ
jgi:hypothetical protein